MRKLEQYRIQDGKTPLNAEELNQRILDIDGRLHVLEEMKISWEAAVAEVQNHGLERINNTVQPVLDAASLLVSEAQAELDAIKDQWQGIQYEWDGVSTTLVAMQTSIDTMQASIDAQQAALNATNAAITAALPVAPIHLANWQTDPDQYTVLCQSAYDSSGMGKDLFYKYVFPDSHWSAMFSQAFIPFSGYDLVFHWSYRMSSSFAGDVEWKIYIRVISIGETFVEITSWDGWFAVADSGYTLLDTAPSALNVNAGNFITIPSSAYSANAIMQFAFTRNKDGGNDTHTGDAEVDDSILLVPVLP